MAKKNGNSKLATLEPVSNGAEPAIQFSEPYVANVTIEGTAPLLFHAWNNEAVEEKAKASKNSEAKKTDNTESYVYRNDDGEICLPGEYLRGAIIGAAKFRQDPRSPRKSAMDLYKAGIISLTNLASLGSKEWDYLDARRVTIQRNSITRHRPAFKVGWQAFFQLQVQTPEYISPHDLHDVLNNAGRLIGVGDFRPSFGRFQVTHFEIDK